MDNRDLLEALGVYGPKNYTPVTLPQLDMAAASLASPALLSTGPASDNWFNRIGEWGRESGFLGYKAPDGTQYQGWGMPAINTAFGLGNLYLGLKQYGVARDTLNFQKDAFNKNYAAQRNAMNSQLEDRQRRRVAENPSLATPVAEYMAKYGVK